MRARRPLRLTIAGALVALLAAACGGSADTSGSGPGNGLEKATLTVGTMPIFDTAPLQLAIKKGFFEEEGLTIKTETVQGGADGIPKVASGSLDIIVGNYVSAFLAENKGIDLHLAAEDSIAANQSHTIMVMPDSGIKTVKDLEGATIAVNTRQNIATLLVKSVLRTHGVAPESVTFTEVPASDMPQVLASGDVDAAQLIEPFGTVARMEHGARLVTDAATGPTKNFPIAGWYSTQEFYEKYTDAVLAFRDAVQRGAKLAHDQGKVEQIIPTYTKVSPETAAAAGIVNFPTAIDPNRLQRVPDLMYEFGLIEKQLDAAEVLGIKRS